MTTIDLVSITCICPVCGAQNHVELTDDQLARFRKWQNRELLIQEALPDMSANEREMLKTGICENCWNDMFGKEEDE